MLRLRCSIPLTLLVVLGGVLDRDSRGELVSSRLAVANPQAGPPSAENPSVYSSALVQVGESLSESLREELVDASAFRESISSDLEVVRSMAFRDPRSLSDRLKQLLTATREIDLVVVWDRKLHIMAIESTDASGIRSSPALIESAKTMQPCSVSDLDRYREQSETPAVVFRKACDFERLLHGDQFSIAYYQPISQPDGTFLGVVGVIQRFVRIERFLTASNIIGAGMYRAELITRVGESLVPLGTARRIDHQSELNDQIEATIRVSPTGEFASLSPGSVVLVEDLTRVIPNIDNSIFLLISAQPEWVAIQSRHQAGETVWLSWGAASLGVLVVGFSALAWLQWHLRRTHQSAKAALQRDSSENIDLIARVSHDIRAPLSILLGYLDLLDADVEFQVPGKKRNEAISHMRRNGQYLLRLCNDLLDLRRAELGILIVGSEPTDVALVCVDCVRANQPRAVEKGLKLSISMGNGSDGVFLSDATRLRQIVENLVTNAIKFTDQGTVVVSLACTGDRTPQFEITVADTGIGMDGAAQAMLFTPYFRDVAANQEKVREGFGIGLAVTKAIVGALGGTISFLSARGAGTTFTVSLPLKPAPEPVNPKTGAIVEPNIASKAMATTQTQTTSSDSASRKVSLADQHIMVADDSEDSLALTSHYLLGAGARVSTYYSGEALIAAVLAGATPSAIVVDVEMIGLSGLETAKKLRSGGFSGPIFASTARAGVEDQQRSIDAGCTAHLTKPFSSSHIEIIAKAIVTHHGCDA